MVGQSLGSELGYDTGSWFLTLSANSHNLKPPVPSFTSRLRDTGLLPGALHYLYEAHVASVPRKVTFWNSMEYSVLKFVV